MSVEDVRELAQRDDVWADVVGQPRAVAALQAAAAQPVHAYLFVGPPGSGKRSAAVAFAGVLLAADAQARGGDVERALTLARAESHPDLAIFEPQGASLLVDDATQITTAASRSPVEGARKVLVLTEFEKVAQAGPALLKTIEEPQASTVFVILAEEVPPELIAIASRAVRVDFGPVPETAVADRLREEGASEDIARAVATASAGDLRRARLLATDESLNARRDAWASIPHRVDGTGATAIRLVEEIEGHIDAAQSALDAGQATEIAELEERIEAYGQRGSGQKDLEARHKREVRRHRTAEIRFGLATMAAEYRDHLRSGGDPSPALAALHAIQAAAEALIRNPNERLLLQALIAGFEPL